MNTLHSPSLRRLALLILLVLSIPASVTAEDWPRWGGPRGDATWQGPKLPDQWPADGLPVAWKQSISGGYGGIAVSNGRAYVQDRVKSPVEQERVLCFDAENGQPLWSHAYPVSYGNLDYGNGPRATPTIHEGRVYTLGALGHFFCLDAKTGKQIWAKDFVKDLDAKVPTWGLAASPVIWKNLVLVHAGAQPNGCLTAFDHRSGKEVWRASDDPAGYCTPIIAHSKSGPQVICWTPKHILGIAVQTGTLNWKIPYEITYGVSIATPLFQNDIALVAGYWDGSKAIRLGDKPGDAKLAWEDTRNLRGLMSQPLYRNGYVYLLDKQYGLTCFELETGKKMWDDKNKMTPRGRNPHAALAWLGDGDRAIILNSEGELILARINPQGYHEQTRTKIITPSETVPVWAHPAFAGTRVFARNETELICVDLVKHDSPK